MGWFLQGRFVVLVSVFTVKLYSLLVISRNYSNTILLIDLQKTKLFQSKILKKGLFFWYQDFDRFLTTTWRLFQ